MKVLTSVSSDYMSLLELWLDQSTPRMRDVPRVACMDARSFERLRADHRVSAFLAPDTLQKAPDRGVYWINRLQIILDELADADGIIHSDADAFWIGDVHGMLDQHRFDIVFSADRGHPGELARKWGFTLCPGFFAIRNGPAIPYFGSRWMEYTRRFSDDQNAINYLLNDLGVVWREEMCKGFRGHRGQLDTKDGPLDILVLPPELVSRDLPMITRESAVLAHPFFDRRFRQAYVDTLRQLHTVNGYLGPIDLGQRSTEMTRNTAMLKVLEATAQDRLTGQQSHMLGFLKLVAGDPKGACQWFDDAIAKGIPKADVAIDSHAAFAATGRKSEALSALQMAIVQNGSSRMARRYAAQAMRIGAPLLAIRAYTRDTDQRIVRTRQDRPSGRSTHTAVCQVKVIGQPFPLGYTNTPMPERHTGRAITVE